jgi:hypothetical protein
MYRCDTTMLLRRAILMMVNASTPDSPSLVSIVWRKEWSTKSAGKIGLRFPSILRAQTPMQVIDGCS